MNFENLTEEVRQLMVDEIEMDISQEKLYPSPRLTPNGILQYPSLLIQAAAQADPSWLEGRLNMLGNQRLAPCRSQTTYAARR